LSPITLKHPISLEKLIITMVNADSHVIIQDFTVHRSIVGPEIFRLISILTIVFLLIIIVNPHSITLPILAQTPTLTTTNHVAKC
jgi:hypothetical protein